jgi:hypothetical protein
MKTARRRHDSLRVSSRRHRELRRVSVSDSRKNNWFKVSPLGCNCPCCKLNEKERKKQFERELKKAGADSKQIMLELVDSEQGDNEFQESNI